MKLKATAFLLMLIMEPLFICSFPDLQTIYLTKVLSAQKVILKLKSSLPILELDCDDCKVIKSEKLPEATVTAHSLKPITLKISYNEKHFKLLFKINFDIKNLDNSLDYYLTKIYKKNGDLVTKAKEKEKYLSCVTPVNKNEEIFRYFCSKLECNPPFVAIGEKLNNPTSLRSIMYSIRVQTDLTIKTQIGAFAVKLKGTSQCKFVYWNDSKNLSQYNSCEKMKIMMNEKVTINFKNLIPLNNYNIILSPVLYQGIKSWQDSWIKFTTLYGSYKEPCFAECMHEEMTKIYAGFRNCKYCKKQSYSNKLTCPNMADTTCKIYSCNTIVRHPCVNTTNMVSDQSSISGDFDFYGNTSVAVGTVILLFSKKKRCLQGLVLNSKNITFHKNIKGLYEDCNLITINYNTSESLHYKFKNLTSATNFILYLVPIITNNSIGLVKRFEQSTISQNLNIYLTIATSFISIFVIFSVIIAFTFHMPKRKIFESSEETADSSKTDQARKNLNISSDSNYRVAPYVRPTFDSAGSYSKKKKGKKWKTDRSNEDKKTQSHPNNFSTPNQIADEAYADPYMKSVFASLNSEEKKLLSRLNKNSEPLDAEMSEIIRASGKKKMSSKKKDRSSNKTFKEDKKSNNSTDDPPIFHFPLRKSELKDYERSEGNRTSSSKYKNKKKIAKKRHRRNTEDSQAIENILASTGHLDDVKEFENIVNPPTTHWYLPSLRITASSNSPQ